MEASKSQRLSGNPFKDDTSPNDQRCDSVNMKRWIRDPDPANAERMKPKALGRRLGEESVRKKLRRAICHFPSEWEQIPLRRATNGCVIRATPTGWMTRRTGSAL